VPQGSRNAIGGKHLTFWLFSHSDSVACVGYFIEFRFQKDTAKIRDSGVLLVEKPPGGALAGK
jgi:hypothetical protein